MYGSPSGTLGTGRGLVQSVTCGIHRPGASHDDEPGRGALFAQVADDLVVAYTTPTVWSTHVVMALTENGELLSDFITSDEVQRLAWERHGFRGASQLGTDSATRFGVAGIAERVPAAVELPAPAAMQRLIEVVGG